MRTMDLSECHDFVDISILIHRRLYPDPKKMMSHANLVSVFQYFETVVELDLAFDMQPAKSSENFPHHLQAQTDYSFATFFLNK